MHDGAELRRAEEFLQELAKNSALPLTDTDLNPLPLSARKNPHSNNPQETHSAPPLATPQRTDLADLPRLN